MARRHHPSDTNTRTSEKLNDDTRVFHFHKSLEQVCLAKLTIYIIDRTGSGAEDGLLGTDFSGKLLLCRDLSACRCIL